MKIQDRIREFRRIPARELVPNPKNWRTHPEKQRDTLKGVLEEIGYADALLVRELHDGSLQLIDGHLRAETTPDQDVPVLILDLNEKEAELLLAVLDPLSALAGVNQDLLAVLTENIETENAALNDMLTELAVPSPAEALPSGDETLRDLPVTELFQIVVDCKNEAEQRELYERLIAEGHACKIANLSY